MPFEINGERFCAIETITGRGDIDFYDVDVLLNCLLGDIVRIVGEINEKIPHANGSKLIIDEEDEEASNDH